VLKPRSSSGVVGVFRRPARSTGSATWVATYGTVKGDRRTRSFSVGKHGETAARTQAIDQRHDWETQELGSALPAPGRRSARQKIL
jgi:hypothetical protein